MGAEFCHHGRFRLVHLPDIWISAVRAGLRGYLKKSLDIITQGEKSKTNFYKRKNKTTPMGFEPTRAEHIGLAVQRLNHSATVSYGNTSGFY